MEKVKFQLKVPATSANLGPGFDTLGVALSLFLNVNGSFLPSQDNSDQVQFHFTGDGAELMSTDPEVNLITQTALYVLRSQGRTGFGGHLELNIDNHIPLGRGLGSSGAAVVAGVLLGDIVGDFKLSQSRLLDFILAVERHPDNVVPCLVGGLAASYVRDSSTPLGPSISPALTTPAPQYIQDAPSSEPTQPNETNSHPSPPPLDTVCYVQLPVNPSIRAVAIIPKYELATSKARGVLPSTYEKADVIYNLQRLAVLTQALGQNPLNVDMVFAAMTDKLHQPFRKHLIPGLPHALSTLTPATHPGLLGLFLSGAGPTVLAFATDNFTDIGNAVKQLLDLHGKTDCTVRILDILPNGSEVQVDRTQ